MPEGKDNLYKIVEENSKKEKDIYVYSDIGLGGRPRICVAKDITYKDEGWKEWWNSIPNKIKKAYENAVSQP